MNNACKPKQTGAGTAFLYFHLVLLLLSAWQKTKGLLLIKSLPYLKPTGVLIGVQTLFIYAHIYIKTTLLQSILTLHCDNTKSDNAASIIAAKQILIHSNNNNRSCALYATWCWLKQRATNSCHEWLRRRKQTQERLNLKMKLVKENKSTAE